MSVRSWPRDFPETIVVQRRAPYESRADSIMYCKALAEIGHGLGWDVHLYDAKRVEARAARILGARADEVLQGPRTTLGPPWSKDHRTALAATIVANCPPDMAATCPPSQRDGVDDIGDVGGLVHGNAFARRSPAEALVPGTRSLVGLEHRERCRLEAGALQVTQCGAVQQATDAPTPLSWVDVQPREVAARRVSVGAGPATTVPTIPPVLDSATKHACIDRPSLRTVSVQCSISAPRSGTGASGGKM